MWIILAYTAVSFISMLFINLLIVDLILGGPKLVSRVHRIIRGDLNQFADMFHLCNVGNYFRKTSVT